MHMRYSWKRMKTLWVPGYTNTVLCTAFPDSNWIGWSFWLSDYLGANRLQHGSFPALLNERTLTFQAVSSIQSSSRQSTECNVCRDVTSCIVVLWTSRCCMYLKIMSCVSDWSASQISAEVLALQVLLHEATERCSDNLEDPMYFICALNAY